MEVFNPALELKRYRDWAPTTFDARGLALCSGDEDDRGDWYVVPVIRTRDSGPPEESNFSAALGIMGGESETVEVHRFGHWACGWFEVILAAPERLVDAFTVAKRLDDHPVLDEDDLCRREWDAAAETWQRGYNVGERIRWIREHGHTCETLGDLLGCVRGDEVPMPPNGDIYSLVG